MIFRPCRDEEAIKPRSASFLPLTDFSFAGAFVARWVGPGGSGSGATLMERATWTNPAWNQAARTDKPSQIYDSPPLLSHSKASHQSFWIYRINTFCHLCLALLPAPHSHPSFECPFIFYLSICYLFFPPSLDKLASCSSRQGGCRCPRNAELHLKSNM